MKWMMAGLLLLASQAQAELLIELVGGRTDAVPIAIVPFGIEGAAPEERIDAIVSADLHRSGQFRPLPAEDMLSRPTRSSEVSYRDFRVLGSDYLV
ncbi:MAG: Tol-Pal system protein TolB, partial [Alcanivoracaceae bacterium]|nr:Tol-Pal system protein TolB [Alcanivoracaceae bacterium]